MPHLNTDPGQHDHVVSAYVIRMDFDEPRVQLHMHKKFGRYTQYGGHVELNESPWQAVIREIEEESGYVAGQYSILQPKGMIKDLAKSIMHPYPLTYRTIKSNVPDHYHTEISYAVLTSEDASKKPKEGETKDIVLLSRDELAEFPSDMIMESIRQLSLFILDHCLESWERIGLNNFFNEDSSVFYKDYDGII